MGSRIAALWSYGCDGAGHFLDLAPAQGGLAALPSQGGDFNRLSKLASYAAGFQSAFPRSHRRGGFFVEAPAFGRAAGVRRRVVALYSGDLAHGVVEGQAEDLDQEVNGVAGPISLGPAPIAVFDDESGKGGQKEIARLLLDQLEGAFLEQRRQRGQPGGPDLLTRPAGLRGAGCHNPFANGVG
jgi:hypothetical protein